MPTQKGKLKPEDAKRIQKNYKQLLDDMVPEDLTRKLYQLEVLDDNDKDVIFSKDTRLEKAEALLEKILFSGPFDSFDKFLMALEDDYSHLAQQLRDTDVSDAKTLSPYAWVSEVPQSVLESKVSNADASRISFCLGGGWEHLFQRLGLSEIILERERLSNPHANVTVTTTNLLIKWTQKTGKDGTWRALLTTLAELEKDSAIRIDWTRLRGIVTKEQ